MIDEQGKGELKTVFWACVILLLFWSGIAKAMGPPLPPGGDSMGPPPPGWEGEEIPPEYYEENGDNELTPEDEEYWEEYLEERGPMTDEEKAELEEYLEEEWERRKWKAIKEGIGDPGKPPDMMPTGEDWM
jgi:hypothetical protein